MELPKLSGIHHVTAICSDAQQNLDFYTQVLGLRLIKVTVNLDDPGAYHLFYGDGAGTTGTALTFFPYVGGRNYMPGNGQFVQTTLAIPVGAGDFWEERLTSLGVKSQRSMSPFGEAALEFGDRDGMGLALIEVEGRTSVAFDGQPVPNEMAIAGMHSVTLASRSSSSLQFAVSALELTEVAEEDKVVRFDAGNGTFVDVTTLDRDGYGGHGGVHHVALATADEASQLEWQSSLVQRGAHVSPVMDRYYFHSIYFREPGGSLFEIATKGPGYLINESMAELGSDLRFPPEFEYLREQVLDIVPPLRLPNGVTIGGK